MLYRRKLKDESNSDSEKDNSSKNLDQNENGEKFDHRFSNNLYEYSIFSLSPVKVALFFKQKRLKLKL